eukprot:979797-Rhodomonas_salina.1
MRVSLYWGLQRLSGFRQCTPVCAVLPRGGSDCAVQGTKGTECGGGRGQCGSASCARSPVTR